VRLHHVNVTVPPGRSQPIAAFYCDVLGFKPISRPENERAGVWLEMQDGTQLHLSERDGAPHPDQHFAVMVDDLNAVLDQTPNRVDALVYRASAYRQLGSIDLATDDIDRALRLDPNSVAGLLERGNLRRLKNDAAGAKADWQQVLKLSPGTPAAASAQDNLAHLSDQPVTGQNLLTGPAAKKTKP